MYEKEILSKPLWFSSKDTESVNINPENNIKYSYFKNFKNFKNIKRIS